ncbi:MAG: 4Fe-4S dicluster domain-containing protein, partial [Candidatus Omnitrophota bacterium]
MMANKTFYITENRLVQFLKDLAGRYNVISPYGSGDYHLKPFQDEVIFTPYRAVTSIRQFLMPSFDSAPLYEGKEIRRRPFCIFGVKACDLQSLRVQDYVFLEGDIDRGYEDLRSNNIIISSDCTGFKDVCFCLNLDINPYPEELFDLNISLLSDSRLLVDVGSPKGAKLMEESKNIFQEASQTMISEREQLRKKVVDDLSSHLKANALVSNKALYNLIKGGYEHDLWAKESSRCVECGACVMNCPTCHCFLLFDTENKGELLRGRTWDGCQYKNYSRV